jgi:hypothetical protein
MSDPSSVFERGGKLLDEHLERLEESAGSCADGSGGWVSGDGAFEHDSPYRMYKRFFDDLELEIEFQRSGDELRYSAWLTKGFDVLRRGPAGAIDLRPGPAAAVYEIDAVFGRVADFIDGCAPLLRSHHPDYHPGPIALFQEMLQAFRDEIRPDG